MLSSSASEAAAYRGQSPNQIHSGEVSSVKHLRRKSVQRGGVRGGAAFIAFRVIKVPLQSKLCLSSCCYSRVFELRWAEWLTDRLLTPEGWFHIHRSKSTSRSLMIWFKKKKKKKQGRLRAWFVTSGIFSEANPAPIFPQTRKTSSAQTLI